MKANPRETLCRAIAGVCRYHGLSLDEFFSGDKARRISWPRQAAIAVARSRGVPTVLIAAMLRCSHSYCPHAVRAVRDRMTYEGGYAAEIRDLIAAIDHPLAHGAEVECWLEQRRGEVCRG